MSWKLTKSTFRLNLMLMAAETFRLTMISRAEGDSLGPANPILWSFVVYLHYQRGGICRGDSHLNPASQPGIKQLKWNR